MIKKNTFLFLLSCMLLAAAVNIFFVQEVGAAQGNETTLELDERDDGFYVMKDIEDSSVIMKTARHINAGDLYIDQENRLFSVVEVNSDIDVAWARFLRDIELSPPLHQVMAASSALLEAQAENDDNNIIAIYHSHGAEAYVPSDGTESKLEGGGILDVGETFEETLQEKPFEAIRSDETHVPHDANAYQRSRRTAEEMLKENPAALFDIHRDAVPAEEYTETVQGDPTVQIQFVVGRQNQNFAANQSFAESLKKTADDLYPGLIKGIFMANGSYNQDLHTSSLLLEVGSHENTREDAQESITLFADVVESYFLGEAAAQEREGTGAVALRSVLWVVLVALVALGLFMLVSTGSKEELVSKIKNFFKKEFKR